MHVDKLQRFWFLIHSVAENRETSSCWGYTSEDPSQFEDRLVQLETRRSQSHPSSHHHSQVHARFLNRELANGYTIIIIMIVCDVRLAFGVTHWFRERLQGCAEESRGVAAAAA